MAGEDAEDKGDDQDISRNMEVEIKKRMNGERGECSECANVQGHAIAENAMR
jgi:hypothetical protein